MTENSRVSIAASTLRQIRDGINRVLGEGTYSGPYIGDPMLMRAEVLEYAKWLKYMSGVAQGEVNVEVVKE